MVNLPDSESTSESWKNLKNVLTKAADTVLGRVDRSGYNEWFDEDCKQVTDL
jgi:hypothetical protein